MAVLPVLMNLGMGLYLAYAEQKFTDNSARHLVINSLLKIIDVIFILFGASFYIRLRLGMGFVDADPSPHLNLFP